MKMLIRFDALKNCPDNQKRLLRFVIKATEDTSTGSIAFIAASGSESAPIVASDRVTNSVAASARWFPARAVRFCECQSRLGAERGPRPADFSPPQQEGARNLG